METSWISWGLFSLLIMGLLLLDLGIFQPQNHKRGQKEAWCWTLLWISIALLFNSGIYFWHGQDAALTFLTAYLLEKSLSLDNLFVFAMIFNFFSTPPHLQPRVLYWGILSAIILRFIMIMAGIKLIEHFEWLLYAAGFFLIYSSVVLLRYSKQDETPSGQRLLNFIQRKLPMSSNQSIDRFFLYEKGKWHITPLFLVLVSIEFSDLVFAVDSIPAVFAITLDPFLVFTSNIFAILGLRSLYFVLADILPRFYYLKHALALILGFIGIKMLLGHYLGISNLFSLVIMVLIIIVALLLSLKKEKNSPLKKEFS